jgi:hypothetical protein
MRAAGLEGHGEGLAGGVHHRLRHQEAVAVQPVQDLEADARAAPRVGLGPGGARGLGAATSVAGVSAA